MVGFKIRKNKETTYARNTKKFSAAPAKFQDMMVYDILQPPE